MKSLCFCVALLCLCTCHLALAASDVTVPSTEIERQVLAQFPFDRTYKNTKAHFFNPLLNIDPLDDTVEIEVQLRSTDDQGMLLLTGTLQGTLYYNPIQRTLALKRPRLHDVVILEDSLKDSHETLRDIRQTIGQSLPDIILLSTKSLKPDGKELILPSSEPTIRVVPQGLLLTF
ncbi:hypothetical protein LJ739_15135 [Aestuariibacter halophilus]|uniref:DUF1439 domain-containing protein n=1 Tax=Fluctibacter halophilus TaxID=226011 RepID=A0ABS8GBW7_9ALTE|nr:hypothetical protein [Aestuariibacter halophilus]MCC2617586.1 hypothetical protein [Aestuariibacter halophilus]